jgi:hypothetical protein
MTAAKLKAVAKQLRDLSGLAKHAAITPKNTQPEKLDTTHVFNFLRFFGNKA